jgi:UDP-4-amino-4,6-dideoxy-N-acetyl-beta-L-altrosamine N-acetyltransferase
MKITRYGITLERLQSEQSEMVRLWRNDPKISQFMFYKGEITAAMQQEWFASIDNEQNFFFIIHYKSAPVGLINISSIDWENKTAYTGLFIYDEQFWSSDVPVMASLALLDVFLLLFDIQIVYAKVKGTNIVAHNYNTALGFSRTKKIEHSLGYEYMLQKEIYLLETKELRNAAIRLRGNGTVIELAKENPVGKWIAARLADAKKDVVKNLDLSLVES